MMKVSLSAVFLLLVAGCSEDQPSLDGAIAVPGPTREQEVGQKLEAVRDLPDELRSFLKGMPKGGDLHSHLSGAVSTESLIQWGADDGLCVDTTTFAAVPPPCMGDSVPLSNAGSDLALKSNILKAWSTEGFKGPLLGRHKHFFDAFGKFGEALGSSRRDDAVAEVMAIAEENGQVYVELIQGLGSEPVGEIAATYIKAGDPWDEAYLLSKRGEIMADPVFSLTLAAMKSAIPGWVSGARQILGCGTGSPDVGCDVDVRFVMSANRTQDRGYVFAQWVFGYELAQSTPEVVGINLASPEEDPSSLANYDDEMSALDVLRRFNEADESRRTVHISLHAGELIQELLPNTPDGQKHLTYHIRRAVETAGAERIGHGVDLAYESDGDGVIDLLSDMRNAGVMVEICLSSNDQLLGTSGIRHPLKTYLNQDVPVALATDDQGVLRTTITDEYVRAVNVQGLDYRRLKQMARTSLEHSFLPGASIWAAPDYFYAIVSDCVFDSPLATTEELTAACAAFLASNERAAVQWKLEADFEAFETFVIASP